MDSKNNEAAEISMEESVSFQLLWWSSNKKCKLINNSVESTHEVNFEVLEEDVEKFLETHGPKLTNDE